MQTPHRLHAPVVSLVLLLSACSTEPAGPTEDGASEAPHDAALEDAASEARVTLSSLHGLRIRLYQSSCSTSFVITEFVPVLGPDGSPVLGPDGRPIPARFTVSLAGRCNLLHFGKAVLTGTQQVVFNADGSQSLHNESQYALSGGDVLYSVSDGTGALSPTDPTTVAFEAWERFTGGTGRFVHARGGARARGSANLATAEGEYRTLGVLGY